MDLTDIQAKAIAPALKGSDILGAARTGSGKTLAFIIPVLENLYRAQCVGLDAGLGAMIISPTRELAIQIFDVLYKIGKQGHLFAAGLVIGGKSLQEEQLALTRMNIVVCTPGRMLQHLSQTAAFNTDNLQMLVLDEADRIMDMGFQRDVDAIVEYLPPSRQTLLFSATQTKKVSDLARLSLRDPEYVAVHEASASATPKTLQQNYVLTPLSSKLDTLWSFIQSSKKSKLLVFLSSGKQVRFVYEAFRRMQPGIPLLHLHGRQKQTARLDITTKFAAAKYSCLFATDVVARGLDFPAVDWVVQVDCPEDADTYIHRVGRTARYERDGRAIIFLDPSEEPGMLERLVSKKVPLERINVRAKKQTSIKDQLQAMCFKDPELKYLGQKAFVSYVRSVHIQKDKETFQIERYNLEEFAASMGLPGAPRIRFMRGDAEAAKKLKNTPRQAIDMSDDSSEDDEGEEAAPGGKKQKQDAKRPRTRYDRMFERQNQDVLSSHYSRLIADEAERNGDSDASGNEDGPSRDAADQGDDGDNDLFTVKRRIPALEEPSSNTSAAEALRIDSARRARMLTSKAKTAKLLAASKHPSFAPKRLVFDEEGVARDASKPVFDDESAVGRDRDERERARLAFLEAEREKFGGLDERDREVERQKRREKKEKAKRRERERERGGAEVDADANGASGGVDDGEDEVRFERMERPFEELADLYESEPEEEKEEEEHEEKPEKSYKRKRTMEREMVKRLPEPRTLEDLEALASGLLN